MYILGLSISATAVKLTILKMKAEGLTLKIDVKVLDKGSLT